jgi:hypothetical protein
VLDAQAVTRECFSEAFSSPHPDLEDFKITLISYSKDGEPKWARDNKGRCALGFAILPYTDPQQKICC